MGPHRASPTGERASTRRALVAVLPAILGALLASALCVAIAVGFLAWRDATQHRLLVDRKKLCETGDRTACDLLRNACLKRSAEACLALADTYLGAGPRHDGAEGARLLAEACEHHLAEACTRAAALYTDGREVPADPGRASDLRQRGCALGDQAACSPAVPPRRPASP